jgi:hypothetical protein
MNYKHLLLLAAFVPSVHAISQPSAVKQDFHKWAKTPPMGWNSWDCYGPTVTEDEVKANADYMANNLKVYGWEYVVVDIRWYVDNDKAHGYNEKDPAFCMDGYGRFTPSVSRFPSASNGVGFKSLADYIHSKGLKFGIHIMRGIPKLAVTKNTPILGSSSFAKDIYSTSTLCSWLGDMYSVDASKLGAQEYYNSLMSLYASWGVDFIKVDDLSRPYHSDEVELIRKAIDNTGRKIVLSTSPGETPIESGSHVANHANMWRIIDDFWDSWPQVKEHFALFEKWIPFAGEGHWPDGDMLPIGKIGIRAERGNSRFCQLTKDEQQTLMSLFAICKSPLFIGGDLPSSNELTLSLVQNRQVVEINQHSTGNKLVLKDNGLYVWLASAANGDKFVAIFNSGDNDTQQAAVQLSLLGIRGKVGALDLWDSSRKLSFDGSIRADIPKHGVKLFRLLTSKAKR